MGFMVRSNAIVGISDGWKERFVDFCFLPKNKFNGSVI